MGEDSNSPHPQHLLSFVFFEEDRGASQVAQLVKNLPAMRETWI